MLRVVLAATLFTAIAKCDPVPMDFSFFGWDLWGSSSSSSTSTPSQSENGAKAEVVENFPLTEADFDRANSIDDRALMESYSDEGGPLGSNRTMDDGDRTVRYVQLCCSNVLFTQSFNGTRTLPLLPSLYIYIVISTLQSKIVGKRFREPAPAGRGKLED